MAIDPQPQNLNHLARTGNRRCRCGRLSDNRHAISTFGADRAALQRHDALRTLILEEIALFGLRQTTFELWRRSGAGFTGFRGEPERLSCRDNR
jgi:hypothetical protein